MPTSATKVRSVSTCTQGIDEIRWTRTEAGTGLTTRSKDATRGSWPYYQEQVATSNKKLLGGPGTQ